MRLASRAALDRLRETLAAGLVERVDARHDTALHDLGHGPRQRLAFVQLVPHHDPVEGRRLPHGGAEEDTFERRYRHALHAVSPVVARTLEHECRVHPLTSLPEQHEQRLGLRLVAPLTHQRQRTRIGRGGHVHA